MVQSSLAIQSRFLPKTDYISQTFYITISCLSSHAQINECDCFSLWFILWNCRKPV